jgi:hypothetical protein
MVLSSAELGGGFSMEPFSLKGPPDFRLHWPMAPFNSYYADRKSLRPEWRLRVSVALSIERTSCEFTVRVKQA